jgi:DNA polymerase III subunit delta
MTGLKSAYLVHGDDHGAIAERRARLRALAEQGPDGAAGVQLLEGDAATPAGVAAALAAMTFALGRRVILVEGAQRFKQADVERELAPALAQLDAQTTVALFAREDAKAKAPRALHDAVRAAGGQIVAQMLAKPWELPRWVRARAGELGLAMDMPAARALVSAVGERPQRLLRELERLALELDADPSRPASVGEQDVAGAARSAEPRAFVLADALVAADAPAATLAYLRLREQGERVGGLLYVIAQRLRDALEVAERLDAGDPADAVRRGLRMPPRAAERFVADVAASDPDRFRRALVTLSELELSLRGGAVTGRRRSPAAALGEDTLALAAIAAIAA